MGLVRKADMDTVGISDGGSVDISTLIRQAVAQEIERQRLEKLKSEREPADDGADAED
jgi:post-segregation antitoxin (ccd killing protein)